MPSKYWIKLYHEILDDPKMGRLPDPLWRRTIELFLLAGDLDSEGVLPAVDDMAWRLRCDPAALTADLEALAKVGIVTLCDGGHWTVTKFCERQAPVSASERGQRYRERQRKVEYYDAPTDTERGANGSFADTDTDTERDTDTENANADAPASEPTPTTFQGWHELVTTSKNPNATLRYMHKTLFPGRAPPDFGYIGRTANNVGGPGRLADLMWQAVPRAPTGDVLRYCMGIARGDREPDKPPEPAGYAGIREFLEEKGVIDGNGIRNREHPRLPGGDVPKIPTDKGHGKSIRDGPG